MKHIIRTIIDRKMNFFGHVRRMKDNSMVKTVTFGSMDAKNAKDQNENGCKTSVNGQNGR